MIPGKGNSAPNSEKEDSKMYMNGGMGPRGPMGHGPNRGPGMGHGPMGGMNRGPMPFGPNGIWRRYPMHYGPMYHRRPMGFFPMWHRPMMGGLGGMIILPVVMIALALLVGVLAVVGEMFSGGGGIIAGILVGLAIYYFVRKRNAGTDANTDSCVECDE